MVTIQMAMRGVQVDIYDRNLMNMVFGDPAWESSMELAGSMNKLRNLVTAGNK